MRLLSKLMPENSPNFARLLIRFFFSEVRIRTWHNAKLYVQILQLTAIVVFYYRYENKLIPVSLTAKATSGFPLHFTNNESVLHDPGSFLATPCNIRASEFR